MMLEIWSAESGLMTKTAEDDRDQYESKCRG